MLLVNGITRTLSLVIILHLLTKSIIFITYTTELICEEGF